MSEHLQYSDYERLIREARMQRSMALGNAIANVVGWASSGVARAFAIVAHGVSSAWDGHISPSATPRR